jgi:hypothetical protein
VDSIIATTDAPPDVLRTHRGRTVVLVTIDASRDPGLRGLVLV